MPFETFGLFRFKFRQGDRSRRKFLVFPTQFPLRTIPVEYLSPTGGTRTSPPLFGTLKHPESNRRTGRTLTQEVLRVWFHPDLHVRKIILFMDTLLYFALGRRLPTHSVRPDWGSHFLSPFLPSHLHKIWYHVGFL